MLADPDDRDILKQMQEGSLKKFSWEWFPLGHPSDLGRRYLLYDSFHQYDGVTKSPLRFPSNVVQVRQFADTQSAERHFSAHTSRQVHFQNSMTVAHHVFVHKLTESLLNVQVNTRMERMANKSLLNTGHMSTLTFSAAGKDPIPSDGEPQDTTTSVIPLIEMQSGAQDGRDPGQLSNVTESYDMMLSNATTVITIYSNKPYYRDQAIDNAELRVQATHAAISSAEHEVQRDRPPSIIPMQLDTRLDVDIIEREDTRSTNHGVLSGILSDGNIQVDQTRLGDTDTISGVEPLSGGMQQSRSPKRDRVASNLDN
eukprot:GILJ01007583.1.p1 GENE.GILJ01007583.1~~GILJ01007583.1.p1  ORF type:complete len:313 (-),score=24.89 GILJ01007583.1:236-1174(-)